MGIGYHIEVGGFVRNDIDGVNQLHVLEETVEHILGHDNFAVVEVGDFVDMGGVV